MQKWYRRFTVTLFALFIVVPACAQSTLDGVEYRLAWVDSTPIHIITVDLRIKSLQVTVGIANDTPGNRRS
ncbi:MAG TPA: hypothetical protein VGM23_18560, partial [Armatimonadota bacterium]